MGGADKYLRWFDTGKDMWPVSSGNVATFFVTGRDAFADIGERLEYDAAKDATLYLLAWSINKEVPMRPGARLVQLGQLLTHFSSRGGAIYAMVWRNPFGGYDSAAKAAVNLINNLAKSKSKPRAKAILDNRTPLVGTHHQKILAIINEDEKLAGGVAWCGGMDIYPDRIGANPLHDVQCKVIGPAAYHLANVLRERWDDHPQGGPLPPLTAQPGGYPHLVQVCRTYPAFSNSVAYLALMQARKSIPEEALVKFTGMPPGDMSGGYYKFSDRSKGVQQVWRAVKKAIGEARKYIYVEDQYFVNKWIGDALAKKLKGAPDDFRIVILTIHPDRNYDIERIWQRRLDVLFELRAADPAQKRWQIYCRRRNGPMSYIHSKTWIFDDELVITGSSNADRRGYTYNSEADVVVAGDLERDRPGGFGAATVAQELRCRLFAMHLGGAPRDYLDPARALQKWITRGGVNVERFSPTEKRGLPDKRVAALDALANGPLSPQQAAASILRAALRTLGNGSLERGMERYVEDPDFDVPEP